MVDVQARAGLDAVGQQRAQHDGGGRRTGDAQRQQRHQGAGRSGVVGGLRRRQADAAALAKFFALFLWSQIALQAVGEEGGDGRAGAGQDADEEPQQGAAPGARQQQFELCFRHLEGIPGCGNRSVDIRLTCPRGLAQHQQQRFGQGKGRHGQEQKTEAVVEVRHAEAQALDAGRIFAHRGQHQAQQGHHNGLEHLPGPRQGGDGGTAKQHQREVIRGLKAQAEPGQKRRQDEQQQGGDGAAHKGAVGGDGQRLAGLAAGGHGVAVKSAGHRPRDARRVD